MLIAGHMRRRFATSGRSSDDSPRAVTFQRRAAEIEPRFARHDRFGNLAFGHRRETTPQRPGRDVVNGPRRTAGWSSTASPTIAGRYCWGPRCSTTLHTFQSVALKLICLTGHAIHLP